MYAGSFPALVTPFKTNLDIDFDAYGRLIDWHIEKGTNGIVPCGCTGEAATLSHDEQKAVIKFAIERVAGRIPVIAGTGSNNTREAVDLTRYAKEVGADGSLSITPYYNKPTAAGQIAHYRAIAEAVAPLVYGTRIDCAQCHDHPLAREIKQAHYWGLVAAFNRGKNVDGGSEVAESAVGGFVPWVMP